MAKRGIGSCLRAAQLFHSPAGTLSGCCRSYVQGLSANAPATAPSSFVSQTPGSWLVQQQRGYAGNPTEGNSDTPDTGGTSAGMTPPDEGAGGSEQGNVSQEPEIAGRSQDLDGNEDGKALAEPGPEDEAMLATAKLGRRKVKWDTEQMILGPRPPPPRLPGHKRGRKPTRAQKGSYNDPGFLEELESISNDVPPNVPLYDIQSTFPYFFEPSSRALDLIQWAEKNAPELLEGLGADTEEPEPYPGARRILRWETNLVLMTGNFNHPMNKKVRCWVYLRDLQEEAGLTDEAIRHIALVVGPRYNPNKGELKLVSEKYPSSEENRQHIMELLYKLIQEGERKYPRPSQEGGQAGEEAATVS